MFTTPRFEHLAGRKFAFKRLRLLFRRCVSKLNLSPRCASKLNLSSAVRLEVRCAGKCGAPASAVSLTASASGVPSVPHPSSTATLPPQARTACPSAAGCGASVVSFLEPQHSADALASASPQPRAGSGVMRLAEWAYVVLAGRVLVSVRGLAASLPHSWHLRCLQMPFHCAPDRSRILRA